MTARPVRHALGIIAVLVSAILAVVASPLWLLATALLATVNLVRYTVAIWRNGQIEPALIPLAFLNIALLAAAVAFAITSH